jgi:HAD superfamily hydrolase (TIGR01509 family)
MTNRNRPAFDLIIFDCDGVLVDSENLSAEVLMGLLAESGIAIDASVFRADFLGRSFAAAQARLHLRTGKSLPPDFHERYLERLLPCFEKRLRPMPGVETTLRNLNIKSCVASSSNPARLTTSLACTGLAAWFGDHVFSGATVKNAKPAPDLFLHAAAHMGVLPTRCLVIEDSEMGLMAARAAGMAVWHFCGGSHFQGVEIVNASTPVDLVVSDMAQLLDMLIASGVCSRPAKGPDRGAQTRH